MPRCRLALFLLTALCLWSMNAAMAAGPQATPAGEWRPPPALDNAALLKVGNFGYIDWQSMQIVALGVGAPPAQREGQNASVVKAMATRASLLDARRNLLEVVKEVSIDSETRVVDFMTQNDVVVNRISGVLQAARVESQRLLPDGAYETRVSMPLSGALGEELTRLPARVQPGRPAPAAKQERPSFLPAPIKERVDTQPARQLETAAAPKIAPAAGPTPPQEPVAPVAQATQAPIPPLVSAPQVPGGGYTGLVVDARGLGFKPALKPELLGPGGLLYPGPNVDAAATAKRGFVRYYRNLDQAQQSKQVGGLPQTVKAVSLAEGKPSGLQLDASAAEQLRLLLQTSGNYLDAGNVVVVF